MTQQTATTGNTTTATASTPSQSRLQQWQRLHHKLGSSPIICFLLGVLALILWLAGTTVQIQTSEYLALGAQTRLAGVAWGVWLQPYLLLAGQAPIQYATAWEYAWVVELITLVFSLVLSVAVVKIASVNPHLAKWFVLGALALILLNSWADYSSSPSGPLMQALVALAVGGIVVVGLPLGLGLIEHGVEEM